MSQPIRPSALSNSPFYERKHDTASDKKEEPNAVTNESTLIESELTIKDLANALGIVIDDAVRHSKPSSNTASFSEYIFSSSRPMTDLEKFEEALAEKKQSELLKSLKDYLTTNFQAEKSEQFFKNYDQDLERQLSRTSAQNLDKLFLEYNKEVERQKEKNEWRQDRSEWQQDRKNWDQDRNGWELDRQANRKTIDYLQDKVKKESKKFRKEEREKEFERERKLEVATIGKTAINVLNTTEITADRQAARLKISGTFLTPAFTGATIGGFFGPPGIGIGGAIGFGTGFISFLAQEAYNRAYDISWVQTIKRDENKPHESIQEIDDEAQRKYNPLLAHVNVAVAVNNEGNNSNNNPSSSSSSSSEVQNPKNAPLRSPLIPVSLSENKEEGKNSSQEKSSVASTVRQGTSRAASIREEEKDSELLAISSKPVTNNHQKKLSTNLYNRRR